MSEPEHIQFARYFASLGLQIVPLFGPLDGPAGSICRCREGASCPNAGKHPVGRYKGMPSKLPNLHQNYAIVLDSYIVVDVDDGDTLANLYNILGFELPETFTVATARGAHLWFKHDEPMATRLGAFPKVDLKSGFTYVVGPGSRSVSGTVYTPVITAPIAPAPIELVKACGKAHVHEPMVGTLPTCTMAWAMPSMERWCDEIRASSTRNNDLLRLSCRAIRSGLYDAETIGLLGRAAMDAGLSREEVERTLSSAFRSVSGGS